MLFNLSIYCIQREKKTFWNRNPREHIHTLTTKVITAIDLDEADKKGEAEVQSYVKRDPEFFKSLEIKTFVLPVE